MAASGKGLLAQPPLAGEDVGAGGVGKLESLEGFGAHVVQLACNVCARGCNWPDYMVLQPGCTRPQPSLDTRGNGLGMLQGWSNAAYRPTGRAWRRALRRASASSPRPPRRRWRGRAWHAWIHESCSLGRIGLQPGCMGRVASVRGLQSGCSLAHFFARRGAQSRQLPRLESQTSGSSMTKEAAGLGGWSNGQALSGPVSPHGSDGPPRAVRCAPDGAD